MLHVVICELDKKYIKGDVWAPLKTEFGLTCAHLDVAGHYQGCILKYPRRWWERGNMTYY